MSATIDVPIPNSSTWIDINTESGIAVGAAMSIQNKQERYPCLIQEQTLAAPPPTGTEGRLLQPGETVGVNTGSDRVWVICKSPKGSIVNVQEA